jgi:hypothetical protein
MSHTGRYTPQGDIVRLMAVLLQGGARVLTVEGTCSESSPSWVRGYVWLRAVVCARREKEQRYYYDWVVMKVRVQFITATDCAMKGKCSNQC